MESFIEEEEEEEEEGAMSASLLLLPLEERKNGLVAGFSPRICVPTMEIYVQQTRHGTVIDSRTSEL